MVFYFGSMFFVFEVLENIHEVVCRNKKEGTEKLPLFYGNRTEEY